MPQPAKAERNRKLFADYLGGMTQTKVAEKYGLTRSGLQSLLDRHNIRLPPGEKMRRFYRRPRVRHNRGRPQVWPNCPDHLFDQYMRLRRTYGYKAAEARAMLDPQFQKERRA